MKTAWVLGILALLFLAACAPPAMPAKETPPAEKAPAAAPPASAPTAPEVGRSPPPVGTLPSERQVSTQPPSEVVVQQKATMSPALRDLLKRADEKVSSVQYLYGGTDTNNLFLDTYLVKGTKMRIKKYQENYYVMQDYYDNVYVDQGVGCCETPDRCKSHNIDNTNKKFDVDVSTLKIPKTPYQWVKEIPADATIVGPQTVDQRSVTDIKYTLPDGSVVEQWVDDNYGIPHKVTITDKSGNIVKYQFNDLVVNSLKDADFVPPCTG